MMIAPTTFYSASAGSGKTYTLAQDYLTILFKAPYHNHYRKMLAVTFTNKAVAEMKERILDHLYNFTKDPIPTTSIGVFQHIQQVTGYDHKQLQIKAQQIHQRLLHDYSGFDIVTIDAFNHRLLRTFARDINLPPGFEVDLDTDSLIDKAVNQLIASSGNDSELTKRLVSFALSKINENKSWDITYDLKQITGLITNENHYPFIQSLKNNTNEDFKQLNQQLTNQNQQLTTHLKELAQHIINTTEQLGLVSSDFKGGQRSSLLNLVHKVLADDYSTDPNKPNVNNLINGNLYTKTLHQSKKDLIDSIASDLAQFATNYVSVFRHLKFNLNILNNLTPLSLLNNILQQIDVIKTEQQIIPIYEFNGILSKQIKDQPAPFIYERLGEKYRHYFIDEFQDTSRMQWENLQPLIANAIQDQDLSGNSGTLMLVGDAKQSIYRWRGGDADQFLNLINQDQLFNLPKTNVSLEYNWRSLDQVVEFNNMFFDYMGNYLSNALYRDLYKNYLHQKTRQKPGGYIQIDLIDQPDSNTDSNTNNEPDADTQTNPTKTPYPQHVHMLIQQITNQGYQPCDICILVNKNKYGQELAQYLAQQGISVVSGQSLLVQTSLNVQLLVNYIQMMHQPDQKAYVLEFLLTYAQRHNLQEVNKFIHDTLHLSVAAINDRLLDTNDSVYNAFAKASLFTAIQYTAQSLGLFEQSDLRLQTFLEFVYEFSNQQDASISTLLAQWQNKKDTLSVPAITNPDAVQIMTIHKSKGLEFPVVIAPYCDTLINSSINPTGYLPVDPDAYSGFKYVLLNLKQEVNCYPETARQLYQQHLYKTEMDHVNNLYVAFTRASEQLYICAIDKPEVKNQDDSKLNYSQIFKRYLTDQRIEPIVNEQYTSYQIGDYTLTRNKPQQLDQSTNTSIGQYQVTLSNSRYDFSTKRGDLWATGAQQAIDKGTLLHNYLAAIININDLPIVIDQITNNSIITTPIKQELINTIQQITVARFGHYYLPDLNILNEQAILTPDGHKYIPDRMIINDSMVTIIDYKTGVVSGQHKQQLDHYAQLLQQMGYSISNKVLIYTDHLKQIVWN